jgi:hypothetical protein
MVYTKPAADPCSIGGIGASGRVVMRPLADCQVAALAGPIGPIRSLSARAAAPRPTLVETHAEVA